MTSATIALTREQPFERVWSKPVREVAAELGISDVGLAKASAALRTCNCGTCLAGPKDPRTVLVPDYLVPVDRRI